MSAELAPYALDPFGPSANPSAYVACEASERARAILERTLDQGRVAAVMGPPGHGKTLLLRLLGGREQERARVAYIPFSTLEPDELFALALNELGVSRPGPPRDVLAALARELARRGGVVILIDDANAMPEASANALAVLYRELDGALRVALAAVQGPAAQRVFRAFGSEIDVVVLASGMTGREARRYVETRLAYGGARPELVAAFDEATIDSLHRASQGVPRRLNQAAEGVVRRAMRGSLPTLRGLTAPRAAPTTLPASAARHVPTPPVAVPVATPEAGPAVTGETHGVLLPEIFGRVPGEPAGAYRIVRGTPIPEAAPRAAPASALVVPTAPAARVAPAAPVTPKPAARPPTPEPLARARRELPAAADLPRPPEPDRQLPIRLVGVGGFLLGVTISLLWMMSRPAPPPLIYGPIALPPAVPSEPVPETVAPGAAPEPAARVAPRAPAARASEPRRAARAPAPIAVSINATPWAVVKIDGREVGETPLAGIPLAPGPHVFEARMPDGTTRLQTITIDAAHHAVAFQ